MRMWGGRFSEANDPRVADFTRSIEVDRVLADDDLDGIGGPRPRSRPGGHPRRRPRSRRIVAGLEGLRAEVAAGTLAWDPTLEDVHLNLEAALADRIGPLGGKVHTGRSRNDQVATDLRLWLRRTIDRLDGAVRDARGGTRRPRRARRHGGPAGDDPHPAGPARPPRPPPPRLRRDARARPRPAGRRPAPGERLSPLGVGRPGRGGLPARPRGDGPRARLRRGRPPTRSTR